MLTTTLAALKDALFSYTIKQQGIRDILEKCAPDVMTVYDTARIKLNHAAFRERLPRVTPFYATKCNPTPHVIKTLADIGASFDCASKSEIEAVAAAGVSGDRIVLAHTIKSTRTLRAAKQHGVVMVTADSASELRKLADYGHPFQILLRIRSDDPSAERPLGSKFGATMDEIPGLLDVARELDLIIAGVAFHVGSGCRNPTAYYEAIANARHVFDIAPSFGFHFHTLDIGGGFRLDGKEDDFFAMCAHAINTALSRYFESPEIRVIAEPGRFMVENAGTLYVAVQGFRERPGKAIEYYLGDGKYGNFGLLHRHGTAPKPKVLRLSGTSATSLDDSDDYYTERSSILYGPTCDSHDIVLCEVALPRLRVGDYLVFENMGAYTVAGSTKFNGFDASEEHVHVI